MKDISKMVEDLKKLSSKFEHIDSEVCNILGTETVRETKVVFDEQAFDGKGWDKRKYDLRRSIGKKILSDTTVLKKSIIYQIEADKSSVHVGVDLDAVPYAQIHNEGGKVEITDKMRSYFWAKYYELSRGKKGVPNPDAQFWKNMALTKHTHIEFPKRQYLGITDRLEKRFEKQIKGHIERVLKSL